MTCAASYARRSNDKTDGFGIPAQKRAIESYCTGRGHDIVEIYVDERITGAGREATGLTS